MAAGPSVAAAILELLGKHGVTRAFGIPGVHNLPFWDADSDVAPRIIGVRHEQAAGYAADGLYRATGDVAAALLTSGPGAANVVAAFGEAYVSGSPMLVLASEVSQSLRSPGGPRGILHEMADQGAMFEAFGATARRARTRQEAIASTVLALRDAWGPPPVGGYVGIPSDVLGEEWTAAIPHIPRLPAPGADPHDITDLAELIRMSPRVVLWLGGGVVAAGAEERAAALATRLGAPVLTSYAGRGLLAGHPHARRRPRARARGGRAARRGRPAARARLVVRRHEHQELAHRPAAAARGDHPGRHDAADRRVRLPHRRRRRPRAGRAARGVRRHGDRRAAGVDGGVRRSARRSSRGCTADARTAAAVTFVEQVDAAWPVEGAVVCDMAVAATGTAATAASPAPAGCSTRSAGAPSATPSPPRSARPPSASRRSPCAATAGRCSRSGSSRPTRRSRCRSRCSSSTTAATGCCASTSRCSAIPSAGSTC